MTSNSLIDTWIEHEKYRERFMEVIKINPLTRHELVKKLGLTRDVVANLIRNLSKGNYIIKIEGEPCSITHRLMGRYTTGYVRFVPKDLSGRKKQCDYNKVIQEIEPEKEMIPESQKTVIKVNEHSTIYMNSRRPQSDFTIKRDPKSPRKSMGAISSGIGMFENW